MPSSALQSNDKKMIERLRNTLVRVRQVAGQDFSGVGLIVHHSNAILPVFPLRLNAVIPEVGGVEEALGALALTQSDLHDGFHLLSTDWRITAIAQYFSPPILPDAEIDRSKSFGGRYLAALFGSALPGVVLCGVTSDPFGLAIFESGREVHFERL